MGIFGYDSIGDMFDGGGKGGSGDQFYSGTNEDYVAAGGTDSGDTTFFDRVSNTADRSPENQEFRDTLYELNNPDSNITREQRNMGLALGAILGGPIGLTISTVTRLQQAGMIGANEIDTTGLPDTGSANDDKINNILDNDSLSEDEKADQIAEVMDEAIATQNVDAATTRFNAISESIGMDDANTEMLAIADNPLGYLSSRGMKMSDLVPAIGGGGQITNRYNLNYSTSYSPTTAGVTTVTAPDARDAPDVETASAVDRVMGDAYQVDAVTGEIRSENLVDADEISADMQGIATGINEDGTVNYTGQALQEFASLDISRIIDTSTTAGKLLAQELGQGNYTDSKATILGQMEIISAEFKDSNGQPKIPTWGQSIAREVNRTIAFTGTTGTAAKAAVVNAMMEASLGIAEKEANFFQTVTLENLSNRQEAIINKATVLAQVEIENLNARETAAVTNAKAFLEMDLTNLANEQQAEVINKQARIDALFNETAEENVNRRFNITNQLENERFYDELSFQASKFNADAANAASMFNAGEINDARQFSLEMEANRQQFEANMQFNIDKANAQWRQEIALATAEMQFEAAAMDVRNSLGLTTEILNRVWDRTDAQLDYIWRSTEADEQRDFELLLAEMQSEGAAAQAKASSKGSIWGSIIGGAATLGAAWIARSDVRLKQDVQHFDTLSNGVNLYTWVWNEEAKRIGADAYPPFGVIAQEIQETHPDAVEVGEDGYLKVNYGKILS